jgi:hypothetical protein
MKTVTNEAGFLNPQMRQIDADAKEGKQTATVVEALVPRACKETGGWHNRLYNGSGPAIRLQASGLQSASICFICGLFDQSLSV